MSKTKVLAGLVVSEGSEGRICPKTLSLACKDYLFPVSSHGLFSRSLSNFPCGYGHYGLGFQHKF